MKHGVLTAIISAVIGSCALTVSAETRDMKLLWGDTHLHTAYSFDAFLNGNKTATPEVAYRYARGEPVIHPLHRARVQIGTPLDFLVIADHAEYLGAAREVYFNGVQLGDDAGIIDAIKGWFTELYIRRLGDGDAGFKAFLSLLPVKGDPRTSADTLREENANIIINSDALVSKTWKRQTELADEYNEPGVFTALIGWEWSSIPGGANLHRVVITGSDKTVAQKYIPFSLLDSPYPEDLWAWLEKTSTETGADFVAIPHNSNISKGIMFDVDTLHGKPFDKAYVEQRIKWEPVAEITQIKGDSETIGALSPNDEFADFETYPWYIQQDFQEYKPAIGDYVRPAMLRGLQLGKQLGSNPYQFGVIGSTDAHTGLPTAEEGNFGGKLARDSTPENKDRADSRKDFASGWSMSASGLAAVWAEENTRSAIMAAIKRREVYATTGPRIRLQMFGGWSLQVDPQSTNATAIARDQGVPMGGVLPEGTAGAPQFMVFAMKDPVGASLDRIQIVKGWLNADGSTSEKIFNVAWSGNRVPDADGGLPAIASTVNLKTGKWDNSAGAKTLTAIWTDPEFDSTQSAFYYARVLQIPTPRHLLLDAVALGLDAPKEGASVIQERAYGSPIWYKP